PPVQTDAAGAPETHPPPAKVPRRLPGLPQKPRHKAAAQARFADLPGRAFLAAGIEDADLLVGQRPADRREHVPGNEGRFAQRHETAKLALAVTFDHRQPELVAPGALERARHRAAPGGAEPEAPRRAAAPA